MCAYATPISRVWKSRTRDNPRTCRRDYCTHCRQEMSIVLTRSPLEVIGMNAGGGEKRRSARLSQEGNGENEPPAKKTKTNGAATSSSTVNTKQQDGEGSKAASKRKRKGEKRSRDACRERDLTCRAVYDEEDDGFTFSKGKRGKAKETKQPAASKASESKTAPEPAPPAPSSDHQNPTEDAAPKTAQKKTRRRFPTTPERDDADKPVRRSKRLSNEKEPDRVPEPSPQRPSHAKSHANTHRGRSPSPVKRPLTVEKKRRHGANGVEEEKVMMISLPFADTPIIKRNKEMRKTSAEGSRRSSAGMRGKRASSLIDEGRGQGKLLLPFSANSPPDAFTCRGVKRVSNPIFQPSICRFTACRGCRLRQSAASRRIPFFRSPNNC